MRTLKEIETLVHAPPQLREAFLMIESSPLQGCDPAVGFMDECMRCGAEIHNARPYFHLFKSGKEISVCLDCKERLKGAEKWGEF